MWHSSLPLPRQSGPPAESWNTRRLTGACCGQGQKPRGRRVRSVSGWRRPRLASPQKRRALDAPCTGFVRQQRMGLAHDAVTPGSAGSHDCRSSPSVRRTPCSCSGPRDNSSAARGRMLRFVVWRAQGRQPIGRSDGPGHRGRPLADRPQWLPTPIRRGVWPHGSSTGRHVAPRCRGLAVRDLGAETITPGSASPVLGQTRCAAGLGSLVSTETRRRPFRRWRSGGLPADDIAHDGAGRPFGFHGRLTGACCGQGQKPRGRRVR